MYKKMAVPEALNAKQTEENLKNIVKGGVTPEEAVKLHNLIDQKDTKENEKIKNDLDQVFDKYKNKIGYGIINFLKPDLNLNGVTIKKELTQEQKTAYINIITWLWLSKTNDSYRNMYMNAIKKSFEKPEVNTAEKKTIPEIKGSTIINQIIKEQTTVNPNNWANPVAKTKEAPKKKEDPKPTNAVKDRGKKDVDKNNWTQNQEQEKETKDKTAAWTNPEQPTTESRSEEQGKTAKENAEAVQNKLNGILLANNPTEEQVNALFWADATYKEARNLLFDQETISQTIENTTKNKPTGKDQKFLHLVAIGCTQGVDADITKITLSKTGDRYDESYITVTLANEQTREILFTKDTDENYSKRAGKFNITSFQSKDLDTDIKSLDIDWSYRTFEKLIKDPSKIDLKTLLLKDATAVFKSINTFNGDKNLNDHETKENGYYNVITDYVVKYTKENMKTTEWLLVLQAYLKGANAQNIKYLGTDSVAQIYNYNKLVDLVNGPDFPQDRPISIEIRNNVKAIENQLKATAPANFQEAAKQSLTEARNKYGKDIVALLSFLWGKWFAKKILGKYYDKFKDQIDKKYEEKYSLSTEEKAQVKDITKWMDQSTLFTDVTKDSDWAYFKDKFTGKDTYTTELIEEESYKLIDPNVVYKAVEAHNKKEENKNNQKDRKSYLTKNDKWAYEIITTVEATAKKEVADMILADDATWTAIARANNQITWDLPKDGKTEDISRYDLDQSKRDLYKINTVKDIGIALTSYAFAGSNSLDYVITETKLDAEVRQGKTKAPENKDKTPEKKLEFNEWTDLIDANGITEKWKDKKIHEIIKMDNAPDSLRIIRKDKTIVDITLENNLVEGETTYPKTYIIKWSEPKKRVEIFKWDTIISG